MAASAVATERKKILGFKLDPSTREKVQNRCKGLGCSFSDYVRDLIKRDIDSVGDTNQSKEIMQGKVRHTYLINATGPVSKITGMIVDGKEYKYCEKCKKYYRRDESGKVIFWSDQFVR